MNIVWDDSAPQVFLEKLYQKHKQNKRGWRKHHRDTAQHLAYIEVPIEQLRRLNGKIKIYPERLDYWRKQLSQGKMETLYAKPIPFPYAKGMVNSFHYRIFDGHHRYTVLMEKGIKHVRLAVDSKALDNWLQ